MENKSYEEDFRIIRAAIDGAKNPIDKLGQFFKNYAIINLITIVFSLIASLYQRLLPEMYIIHLICFMYLVYYILRIYKEEKSNANQYYQTILYIYGIGVVVIPVILWIAGIISSFASSNEAFQVDKMMEMLMNLEVFLSIILVSVSFLIVSFVRDNKMYIVYALINLAVYLIAFSIDKELSIENITIHYQDLYYSFVIIIGYMILAKSIRKNDYN